MMLGFHVSGSARSIDLWSLNSFLYGVHIPVISLNFYFILFLEVCQSCNFPIRLCIPPTQIHNSHMHLPFR